jgi:hypothetical protein
MAIEPGSTLKTAQKISIADKPRIFKDVIGGQDKIDLYSFKVRRGSSFNLLLSKLRSNVDVSLLNRRGKTLIQSRLPGKRNEVISTTLETGTYYLRVVPRSQKQTSYQLSLSTRNATPTLSVTPEAKINLGANTVISNAFLKATDREQSTKQLVYTLTNAPRSGRLLLNGVELGIGNTFTQDDIDNARLSYVQLGNVTQLTNNETGERAAGIDGTNVAWTGLIPNVDNEIFFYEGATGTTTQLTDNQISEIASGISGINVVWSDEKGDAFFYNGVTKTATEISGNIDLNGIPGIRLDINGGISGNNIILNSIDEVPNDPAAIDALTKLLASGLDTSKLDDLARLLDLEVVLYNTATGATTRLTNNSTGDLAGGVSGANATWSGFDGNDFEIFFYEGATGKTTQLTNNTTDDLISFVSGSNVVWTGSDGNDDEIFFYNGTTGTTTQLTNNNTADLTAGISGTNVVWTGFDGTDFEVFFYDSTTGTTTQLTNNNTIDLAGGVSGANVVWTGSDGTDDEIFLRSFVATNDSISFTVTDGLGGSTSGSLNITIS